MSETVEVTEEVITTEVIVDAGSHAGEIVVADMDNDFVAEEVRNQKQSSFFVQKLNFDFPRKLSIFLGGEKLVKMLWFWTF